MGGNTTLITMHYVQKTVQAGTPMTVQGDGCNPASRGGLEQASPSSC